MAENRTAGGDAMNLGCFNDVWELPAYMNGDYCEIDGIVLIFKNGKWCRTKYTSLEHFREAELKLRYENSTHFTD